MFNVRTRRPFSLGFACATVIFAGFTVVYLSQWPGCGLDNRPVFRWTRKALQSPVILNGIQRPAGLHPDVRVYQTEVIKDESCVAYRLPWEDPAGASLTLCTYSVERDPGVSDVVRTTQMWEPHYVTMVMAALKTRDKENAENPQERISLVDIGCNIGTFTVVAASLGYDVLCVDAMEESLEHVQTSLLVNNISERVTMVHNALSDTYGTMMVEFCKGCGPASSKILPYEKAMARESVDVMKSHQSATKSVHMDDLIPLVRSKRVVIKMDIESAEGSALMGAPTFFDKISVLEVMMEWEHVKHKPVDREFVLQYMGQRDFRAYKSLFDTEPLAWKNNMTWPNNIFWHK